MYEFVHLSVVVSVEDVAGDGEDYGAAGVGLGCTD